MRKRSTESTIKDPNKKDRPIRKSSFQQKYQYDNSNTRRCNNGFFNFILQVMQKKFAVFGILSFTVLLMVAIHLKFLKSFSTERDSKARPFPPNPEMPLPPSSSLLRQFENAAINSDSEECSLIGRTILQKNGSIIDAALSIMFCLGLTSMQSMGLGGGFIMNLFIQKDGKAYTIDARERAPMKASNESYYSFKFNDNKMFTGPLSIATPGEVLGYWELHKKFSLLKWTELIQPTINLCENGFTLSKHLADSFRSHSYLKRTPYYREMFLNGDTGFFPKKPGEKVKPPPSLCATYRLLARNGGNDFYTGELAELILADLGDIGSPINKNDLEFVKIRVEDSIPIKLTDNEILYVTPPPSSGLIVAFAVNILKNFNMTAESDNKAVIYHRIVEALKFAFALRPHLCDPLFLDPKALIDYITSSETTDRLNSFIDDEQTFPADYYYPNYEVKTDSGTSHLSIIAQNGDAVSVTSSINYYFGSGLAGSRTGIIFNSGLDDFSFPEKTNYFNLPPSPVNFMRPFKRAATSMAPIIVTDNLGNVKIVMGGAGGVKIISAVLLALVRMVWLGDDVKQAVDAPRIHHQLLPMVIEYEYGNEQTLIDELEKRGHYTERYTNRGSILNALYRNESGIYGVADHRKPGEVIGY